MDHSTAGSAGGAIFGIIFSIIYLGFVVLMIASLWRVFTKAGQPGWASIIPIFNLIVLLKEAGKPIWWIILLCIPIVNIVIGILVVLALAANFGKKGGFATGLILLPFIFYPILAFGDSNYSPSATPALS